MESKKEFIIDKFKKVKALGFISSHRESDTGIGKTFEDKVSVVENNQAEPDLAGFEIKTHREESNSYVTLFTKAPSFPKGANAYLNKNYGEPYTEPEKKVGLNKLHTSIYANDYNTFADKLSFKLINDRGQRIIRIGVYDLEHNLIDDSVGYNYDVLEKTLKKKLHNLFYVSAETKNEGGTEYFYFNKAEIYTEPSFDKFLDLLDEGKIRFDIRIGSHSNGKSHDHGSGFRMVEHNIKELYSIKEAVK
jgi:hypothetical protein